MPALPKERSDFMDVFRALHQAGDLVCAVFRCVDLCIDPNDGGKKVSVSQENICIDSKEKAVEHLKPIYRNLAILHYRQAKNLKALNTLL